MVTARKVGIIILIIAILFGLFLLIITITNYKPEEITEIIINNNQGKIIDSSIPLTCTSFNIGYGGLDENQNFFADGGSNSRAASREKVVGNLNDIIELLDTINSDFLLLQEVDFDSSRSYKIDQVKYFQEKYPNYSSVFGINYKVAWVPVPILKPMGKAYSGILTLSKYHAIDAFRVQLPGTEKWPIQLFELDRCFIETRFPVNNGKELVLLNSHLSAFDKGGVIRQQQLNYLKSYIENEYFKGNYIIVGGDWNHNLPDTDPYSFNSTEEWPFWLENLPQDFKPRGFSWAIDKEVPTVRTLAEEYTDGYNFLAVIDGFLISDNVEVLETYAIDNNFRNSDHNPVTIEFLLK
ncbi:endonuclease/exonuclease/phosphatase family protein [Tissierella sp. MSJ-40]|uniref:Endonuclease/exonuclease/phosphatase family protein n=1 Tax=Tissierella simiarum TaxID=2841534 RepID=A0ABS6EAQ3_9FIRM|nr:endonuclease/exonuclease/phosphatase family protein [Tissierella simiarum]MBU5439996.1 endonuclease/exonuclease/phosphatase family protein [Tissierella simiarum]